MAKLSTQQASQTHRVMVYGLSNTGKSQITGELAEHFNLIWFDLENGHDVLFKMPIEWQERIELIKLPDTSSYPIAIETCLKVIKGKLVKICEQHGKVGCMICTRAEAPFIEIELDVTPQNTIVVFDSDTQLTLSAISHITKSEPDDYKLKTDDWGHLSKLMDIFHSHVQNAHYNIVVISHETETNPDGPSKNKSIKNTRAPIAGSRNFSKNVAKYFSDVVYCEVKAKKHRFYSGTTEINNVISGSRGDIRLEDMEVPSLLAIFKPELYLDTNTNAVPAASSTNSILSGAATNADKTKSVLERLKEKKLLK